MIEKTTKAKNITKSGVNIDGWIVELSVNFIVAGWWRVLNQSTENLIMGKLASPIKAIIEVNFSANWNWDIIFQVKM